MINKTSDADILKLHAKELDEMMDDLSDTEIPKNPIVVPKVKPEVKPLDKVQMFKLQPRLKFKPKTQQNLDPCECPTRFFTNDDTGNCWMLSILTILLYTNGLREIIIPQINDYTDKQYSHNDPNNIFIPFNIITEEEKILFVKLSNKFIKLLQIKIAINKDNKLRKTAANRESRLKVSKKASATCDESLQKIININKKKNRSNDVGGGNYSSYIIVIAIFNYLFMTQEKYIDATDVIINSDIKIIDITEETTSLLISFSTSNGNHATSIFKCNDTFFYYDSNLHYSHTFQEITLLRDIKLLERYMKTKTEHDGFNYGKYDVYRILLIKLQENKFELTNYNKKLNIMLLFLNYDVEIVLKLIECDQTILTTPYNGNIILHEVLKMKYNLDIACDLKNVTKLIDDDKKVLTMQYHDGKTPLHYALILSYDKSTIALLIDRNETVLTMQDHEGKTPLHYAFSLSYDKSTIALLIDRNETVLTMQDHEGKTPLHYAFSLSYDKSTIALLIDRNKKVLTMQDHEGETPLHYALILSYDESTITLLIDSNETVLTMQDHEGKPPLHYALSLSYDKSTIALLIDRNKKVLTMQDHEGKPPLHYALRLSYDVSIITLLIDRNKKVLTMKDSAGNTPLHYALDSSDDSVYDKHIIALLIDPNQKALKMKQNFYNKTPLHYALEQNVYSKDIIELLIDCDKEVLKMKEYDNYVPLQIALINNITDFDIIKLLVNDNVVNIYQDIVSFISEKQEKLQRSEQQKLDQYSQILKYIERIVKKKKKEIQSSITYPVIFQGKRKEITPDDDTKVESDSKRPKSETPRGYPSLFMDDGGNNKYKLILFHHCY
jgi:ankyrin repeat protein